MSEDTTGYLRHGEIRANFEHLYRPLPIYVRVILIAAPISHRLLIFRVICRKYYPKTRYLCEANYPNKIKAKQCYCSKTGQLFLTFDRQHKQK